MAEQKQTHLKLVYSSDAETGAYALGVDSNERYSQIRRMLRAVLDAKLTPMLTVEQACHLRTYGEDEYIPRVGSLLADVAELRSAGLDASIALGGLPAGIVLTDPARFKARFPQLSDVVPVMLAHGGVQPYTAGLPRHAASRSDA